MKNKRYDNKGRELLPNEYQKNNGRYEFRYMDAKGIWRSVYSWTLKKSDQPPAGKVSDVCLRDMEKQIERDICDGIDNYAAQRMTLNAFFEELEEKYRDMRS